MIDSNHDIVPTLRMFDGLVMGHAADEIERLRKELAALRAQSVQPDAYIGVKKAAQILQDRKAGIPPTPAQQVQLTGDRMAYESMCEPSIAQPAPAARAQMTEDQIINLVIKCEKDWNKCAAESNKWKDLYWEEYAVVICRAIEAFHKIESRS